MSARKTQSPIYSPFEFALQSDMRLAGKPWIITVVLVFVNILDGIKETQGISPWSLDHQLVPVQRTVLLLPAEDRASLPEPRGLHMCEESLDVPEVREGDAPLPPSPTAPSSQCAPSTVDPEVAQLNHFLREVISHTEVDMMEPYTCTDCGVSDVVMF